MVRDVWPREPSLHRLDSASFHSPIFEIVELEFHERTHLVRTKEYDGSKLEEKGNDIPISIPNDILEDPEELSKMCHEHDEPIFLTEDGYGDLVAMSPEVFERFEMLLKYEGRIEGAKAEAE